MHSSCPLIPVVAEWLSLALHILSLSAHHLGFFCSVEPLAGALRTATAANYACSILPTSTPWHGFLFLPLTLHSPEQPEHTELLGDRRLLQALLCHAPPPNPQRYSALPSHTPLFCGHYQSMHPSHCIVQIHMYVFLCHSFYCRPSKILSHFSTTPFEGIMYDSLEPS